MYIHYASMYPFCIRQELKYTLGPPITSDFYKDKVGGNLKKSCLVFILFSKRQLKIVKQRESPHLRVGIGIILVAVQYNCNCIRLHQAARHYLTMGKFPQSHYISALATSFYGSNHARLGKSEHPGQGLLTLKVTKKVSYDSGPDVFILR